METKRKRKLVNKVLRLPEGVTCELHNQLLIIKGPKGEVKRNFLNPKISLSHKENSLILSVNSKKQTKKDKVILNTFNSHIKNILSGIVHNYQAELKICSGHFPMNVNISGHELIIKNFLGEKIPRRAHLYPDVKVDLNGDIVKITGPSKESVGQTAANIETATRVKKRDRRVFQDGIWIIKKPTIIT